MAINFNGNGEPKDYVFFFTLAFLHVDGNILVVNIQMAERGSSVCIVLALHSAG